MPNKERERFYLKQLRACSIGLPDGETRDSESPDFLIFAEATLGVEFTEFHLPAGPGERPHQEIQSLQEQVITLPKTRTPLAAVPRCTCMPFSADIARLGPYKHPFDRLLWLEPHAPSAIDLGRTVI